MSHVLDMLGYLSMNASLEPHFINGGDIVTVLVPRAAQVEVGGITELDASQRTKCLGVWEGWTWQGFSEP